MGKWIRLIFISWVSSCNALSVPSYVTFPDWQPNAESLCQGYYVLPEMPLHADKSISIHANESTFNPEGVSTASGDVGLYYEDKKITAHEAQIFMKPTTQKIETVQANGGIEYLDPNFRVWGSDIEINVAKNRVKINNINYRLYDRQARGRAKKATFYKDGIADLYDATYTTCAPTNTTWELKSDHIHLDRNKGWGSSKHTTIKFYDTPIFYSPYLSFPIDARRKTGFTFPKFGSTARSGYGFSFPFYLNLAPNYDLTLTPRILTKRSPELQTEFRYLTQFGEGTLLANILPDDETYRDFRRTQRLKIQNLSPTDPRILALEEGNHRVAFSYHHHSKINPHFFGDINYDYVGDDNYFADLGNDLNTASTTHVLQQGKLNYQGTHWHHYWQVQKIQTLYPIDGPVNIVPYKLQPQWNYTGHYPFIWPHLNFDLEGNMTRFTHERDPVTGEIFTEGERYQIRPIVTLPFQQDWGFIVPKIKWDFTNYQLKIGTFEDDNNKPQHPYRSIPIYSIDSGLNFDRQFLFPTQTVTQTFEPRLFYLYIPFRDQSLYPNFDSGLINFSYFQLFRDNRFSGLDRIGDTNQLTLALQSRFLGAYGQELVKIGIGEIFYFSKRAVTLCDSRSLKNCSDIEDPSLTKNFSDLIGKLDVHFDERWSAYGTLEHDPARNLTNKTGLSLHYQNPNRTLYNFGYYWIRIDPAESNYETNTYKSLRQVDVSFSKPFSQKWAALGGAHYDFVSNHMMRVTAGIEYDSCCVAWQFVLSRYYRPTEITNNSQYNNTFMLQVMLKGLSNFSPLGRQSKLSQEIYGYQPFQSRQSWQKPITSPIANLS
jgi:LPS-assembly protein